MTENQKTITLLLSKFYGQREDVSTAVDKVAAWHDDEMKKLKERCAEAGNKAFIQAEKDNHLPISASRWNLWLAAHAAILAVEATTKTLSPFGCECWEHFGNRFERLSHKGTLHEYIHVIHDADAHCRFCGKPRVK